MSYRAGVSATFSSLALGLLYVTSAMLSGAMGRPVAQSGADDDSNGAFSRDEYLQRRYELRESMRTAANAGHETPEPWTPPLDMWRQRDVAQCIEHENLIFDV